MRRLALRQFFSFSMYEIKNSSLQEISLLKESEDHIEFKEVSGILYNGAGNVTECIDLTHGGSCVGLNIPFGQWHTIEVVRRCWSERGLRLFRVR